MDSGTEMSMRMLNQWKNSPQIDDNNIAVTPHGKSSLMSGGGRWSMGVDTPSRQRATVLFDTNDGGQIMVTYDAPPAQAPRPRQATTTAVQARDEETDGPAATNSGLGGECQQMSVAADDELQRQAEEDTQQVGAASSSDVIADPELCDIEKQATSTMTTSRNSARRDSVGVGRRPQIEQKAAGTVAAKSKVDLRRSVSILTSTRRQSLGGILPLKSKSNDQSAATGDKLNMSVAERPSLGRGASQTNAASRVKTLETSMKDEARFPLSSSASSRSVSSTSRRSSLMKATASSLAKRSGENGDDTKENLSQAAVSGGGGGTRAAASTATSMTSKIAKLVKGGGPKPAGASKPVAASTSPSRYNKRLSLDPSVRPRRSLMTGKTHQPRDVDAGRKPPSRPSQLSTSINVGHGQGQTPRSSREGIVAGRGQLSRGSSVQQSTTPATSLTKSSSTTSLRTELARNSAVSKKPERNTTAQLRKDFSGGPVLNKQHLYDPLATSPDPLFSPPSPEPSNSAAAAQIKMRGSQTEGRRKWTESKCTEDNFVVSSIYHLTKRIDNKTATLLRNSNRVNWMHAEDSQQQQQQSDGTPTENCLPQFKSSDPYLASILRHLRATDQRLDEVKKALAGPAADENAATDHKEDE